jgi:hypothetical protein
VAVTGSGETTSPMDRQRDEVTHGAAAACIARGADVAVGRQREREVAAAAAQLSRARDASVRAPFKRRVRLTSGPRHFLFIKIFKDHILIFELVTFLISKFCQIFHRDIWKHKEELSFWAQLQIPKVLQVINLGINSNLNLP